MPAAFCSQIVQIQRKSGRLSGHNIFSEALNRFKGETMERYLIETRMLNFRSPDIKDLIERRGWKNLPGEEKIRSIYNFCKDEILFGFNSNTDDMPASGVLAEKIGHCNTKATLFMALLRAVGVPCRIHAFTITKKLQKGAMGAVAYFMAPDEIIHTWADVFYNNQWLNLEGLILDPGYLCSIQRMFKNTSGSFSGYAIATQDLHHPQVEWNGGHTYIQDQGIVRDLGIFDAPDDFYKTHGTNVKGFKKQVYKTIVYRLMNANVRRLRNCGQGPVPGIRF
jgi:hypothetical protein